MFEHAKTTHRDRKVTFSFDGPAVEKEEFETEDWHQRINVTVSHNPKKKCYEAYVRWCKAAERNGYTMEQHAIFTDPLVLLMQSEPVGRYNENKFNAFVAQVQIECNRLVDESVDTVAGTMLRHAQAWSVLAEIRN